MTHDEIKQKALEYCNSKAEEGCSFNPLTVDDLVKFAESCNESKPLKDLTDQELDARIVYSGLDDIISALERMTSGNFMHNKLSCIYMARNVRSAVERLGIKDI